MQSSDYIEHKRRSVRWISSYISQFVSSNGTQSFIFSNTSGVPYGSHLGSFFFIIYLNDIGISFRNCFILLDAGWRSQVLQRGLEDCRLIQEDLERLINYNKENSMYLTFHECHKMIFSRNVHLIHYQYKVAGCLILEVDSSSNLRVIFNTKLIFILHLPA